MHSGLGVTRVVVGRELSVREIAKVAANTGTEVEAFCHGALCVSYSGQCFSSGGSHCVMCVRLCDIHVVRCVFYVDKL